MPRSLKAWRMVALCAPEYRVKSVLYIASAAIRMELEAGRTK